MEAVQNTSKALVDLNEARGIRINDGNNKSLYDSQMAQQQKVSENIQNHMRALSAEMSKAASIFQKDSNEYRALETSYQELQTAFAESESAYIELRKTKFELDFKPLEHLIDKIKDETDRIGGLIDWKKASGTLKGVWQSVIYETDYRQQILNNNDTVNLIDQWKQLKLQEID